MTSPDFLNIRNVSYSYAERRALSDFSLQLQQGEIFGLLGPNGGGKSTLFKLLCTLRPLQQGEIKLAGLCYRCDRRELRQRIGTVFQNPALDKKLTVYENLWSQGKLFALPSAELQQRISSLAERFGLQDRLAEPAEKLSGGLQRRVEIAKALLHQPRILIMDEPSTGLDPGIRLELWSYLRELQAKENLTILLTTHLLEEAEYCDRIALLHQGQLLSAGKPSELCASLGGQVLTVQSTETAQIAALLEKELGLSPQSTGTELRLRLPASTDPSRLSQLTARLSALPAVHALTLSRPSLADLYLEQTGYRWNKN
jgi:ABC-2 type transport system ATP-binding protein